MDIGTVIMKCDVCGEEIAVPLHTQSYVYDTVVVVKVDPDITDAVAHAWTHED